MEFLQKVHVRDWDPIDRWQENEEEKHQTRAGHKKGCSKGSLLKTLSFGHVHRFSAVDLRTYKHPP
jgi:hypothetical protein